MSIKSRQLKELDIKELNSVLDNIYREINQILSVVSEQDNKALEEPVACITNWTRLITSQLQAWRGTLH